MQKRGISHVEVIISFVLFVTAIGFGLYFFNTGDSTRLVDSVMAYSFREIEQNTTSQVEIFSVKINKNLVSSGAIGMNFDGVDGNVRAQNYDGDSLNSFRAGNLVYVASQSWANNDFIYVIFSDEFENGASLSGESNPALYEIGSSEVKKVISEKKFIELKKAYDLDYTGLKDQDNFNIPKRADFGFSIVFDDGRKISAEKEIPSGFDVFSENKRVEVLREDGSIVFADLVVKVW